MIMLKSLTMCMIVKLKTETNKWVSLVEKTVIRIQKILSSNFTWDGESFLIIYT